MLGSLMNVKNAKTTKYYRNRLLVCCWVRCRLPPPSAKQTSPKCRGHLRAATRCYARPWFPTADLSKISFLVSRSSLGIRGANTSITSTIHLLIFLISSLHSLGFPNATDRAFCSQSSTLAPYFPHKSTKHRKTTTSMCNMHDHVIQVSNCQQDPTESISI